MFQVVIFSLCYAWFGCQFPIAEFGFSRNTAPFKYQYTLYQNDRHFSILLFPSKLALMASLKV